jgi:hypothetical protein
MTAASGRTSNYNSTHVNISYIQQNFDSHNSQQKKKATLERNERQQNCILQKF